MKIIIRETSAVEVLSLIDPKSGEDTALDFIADAGALDDGQFKRDLDHDTYICDQDTFDWWHSVVDDNQALANRIHDLVQAHGHEAVYGAIEEADNVDLEAHAAAINRALDAAFRS